MSTKTQKAEMYLDEWKSRIKQSEASRQKQEGTWKKHVGYYKNKMWKGDDKLNVDKATVNQVYPLISIIRETTYNQNPKIYIKPTRPEFGLAAEVIEALVNNLWYNLKINRTIRRCIVNAALQSLAVAELGFSGQHETGEIKPYDMPYVRSTSPTDFITDTQCETFDDEQSFFRGFKRKVAYSQFKEMYPKAAKELGPKLKEKSSSETDTAKVWPDGIAPWKRVEYWNIQDLHTNKFFLIHPDLKEFIDIVDNPYSVEGFLSEVLVFNEIPGELWPMSDIVPVEYQQKELNQLRTAMGKHWKKLIDVYVYLKDSMPEEDLMKIINAEDVELIGLDDISKDGSIRLLEKGPLSNEFYAHEATIKEDWRNITPINEYIQGGMVPGTKTAFETKQITGGTKIRLQGHGRAVTDFVESIARKLVQILKDYYTLPIVTQIAGARGELVWREFSRWEIQAEVDVTVHLGSTMPPDEQQDRLTAGEFYQRYRQDPLLDQRKVVVECLRRESIPNAERFMLPGPAEPFSPETGGQGANQSSNTAQGLLRGEGRGI